jgi:hypothetical protein
MSFDLRRCSKEDLDAMNARARAWKAQQANEADAPPPVTEETQQLDLDLG